MQSLCSRRFSSLLLDLAQTSSTGSKTNRVLQLHNVASSNLAENDSLSFPMRFGPQLHSRPVEKPNEENKDLKMRTSLFLHPP